MSITKTIIIMLMAFIWIISPPSWAETTTVKAKVILDKNAVTEKEIVNLSILALNRQGEVDRLSEAKGSTIMAVVDSIKGEVQGGSPHPGATPTDEQPSEGYFASQVRYVRINQGLGRVSVYYPCEAATPEVEAIDTITVYLQERVPTSGGGIQVIPIGQPIKKTVSVTHQCGDYDSKIVPLIREIKPAEDDPQGEVRKEEVEVIGEDGQPKKEQIFIAQMTAGIGGMTIAVNDENFGKLRKIRAAGDALLELKHEGEVKYSFTETMQRGEALFTLTSEITEARPLPGDTDDKPYTIEISVEDDQGEFIPLGGEEEEKQNKDQLIVKPKRELGGLRLRTSKEHITMAAADKVFDHNGDCQLTAPVDQVCEAAKTYLTIDMLDEYGNKTYDKNIAPFTISIEDSEGVVSNAAVTFKAYPECGIITPIGENVDEWLGNQAGEILKLGTASLIAKPDRSTIPHSEQVSVQVGKNALILEPIDVGKKHEAGTEFEAFTARVANEEGQIYLADGSVVDYDDLEVQQTLNPGNLKMTTWAGETRTFSRRLDNTDIVEAYFEKATYGYDKIVDIVGNYPLVDLSTWELWEIIPAPVTQVKWDGTDEQEMEFPAIKIEEDRYKTVINSYQIKMLDNYDNEIYYDLGKVTAESENGEVKYYTSDEVGNPITPDDTGTPSTSQNDQNDNIEVPVSDDCQICPASCEDDISIVIDSGIKVEESGDRIEVIYDAGFVGENRIELSFTKPGLDDKKLVAVTTVPPEEQPEGEAGEGEAGEGEEEKEEEEMEVTSYIETTSLPVNSEVAMTVESKNKDEDFLIFFNQNEGDNLVPNVYQLMWEDSPPKDDAQSDESEDENEAECPSGYILNDKCQQLVENRLISGNKLPSGRNLLLLKAGSQEGQFSFTFTDAGLVERHSISFEITPSVVSDTTIDDCQAEGNYWDEDKNECLTLSNLNNPDEEGKSAVVTPDGQISFTSNAHFNGGVVVGDGEMSHLATMRLTSEATSVSFVGNIEFDNDDVGKTVDIVIIVGFQFNPLVGGNPNETYWYTRTPGAFPFWDGDLANIESYQSDYVITEDKTHLNILIFEGAFSKGDAIPGIVSVYLGYRLETGQIKFGASPVILQLF
jgi:hypothetical protein